MLMAYLPAEKIVIEADLYDPPAEGQALPAATDVHRAFLAHVRRLGLEVSRIAPIHGPAVEWSQFLKVVGAGE
jgi:hypothetical protein